MNVDHPEPGSYPNMPMGVYLALNAINASSLKYARRSMQHVKAALDGMMGSDTPATNFGTLAHNVVLEPGTLEDRYAVDPGASQFPKGDGSLSSNYTNTASFKKWKAEQAKPVVSKDDVARALVLRDAVHADARAMEILGDDGDNECVMVWIDPATGVLCKCRVDRLRTGYVVDLKTTREIGRAFEQQFSKLDYVLSSSFYRRGAAAQDGIIRQVGIVVVESDTPHAVQAAPVDDDDMDAADKRIDRYLLRVKKCQEEGVWPGPQSPDSWKSANWVNYIEEEPGEYDGVDLGEDPGDKRTTF